MSIRKDISREFLNSMLFFLNSTKPLVLLIESTSIYERMAVAHALADKIQTIIQDQKKKPSVFYALNKEDLKDRINKTKNNDILIVDTEEGFNNIHRKQIEIKSLNYLLLAHSTDAIDSFSYVYKIKVVRDLEEKKMFICLLFKNTYPVGYVKISKRDIDYDQLLEEIKTPVQRIIQNVEHSTEKMLKKMYATQETCLNILFSKKKQELRKTENAIRSEKSLIYGDVGTGKSTLLEIFNGLDQFYYKAKHVHSRLHENDLQSLLVRGWSKNKQHFIQSINVEDMTYSAVKDLFTMHSFINLRHTMNERSGGTRKNRSTGLQQGKSKCRTCLHRLTGDATPTAYRSSFDWQFFLGFPSLKFDCDYIEAIIGPIYVTVLKYITGQRDSAEEKGDEIEFEKWLGWGVWVKGEHVGIFHLPIDKYPFAEIEVLDAPVDSELEDEITHWHDWEIEIRNKAAEQLALKEVQFGDKVCHINLWGARDADIPRFDAGLCEVFLLENYPEVKELIPKRRQNFAKAVLQLARYWQYGNIAPGRLAKHFAEEKEKEQQFQWAQKNWSEIAAEGIDNFSGKAKKPTTYEINNWLVEKWIYKKKALPRTINKINFFQRIINRIKSDVKDIDDSHFIGLRAREKSEMINPPGGIVEKFRTILNSHKDNSELFESINDLDKNLFENKSYGDLEKETNRIRSTISQNINRAWNRIGWKSWEQAIFTLVLENLTKNHQVIKIINGKIVTKFPHIHTDKDIFAIGINVHTKTADKSPPISDADLLSFFAKDFANPSHAAFYSSFQSSPLTFMFLWLGGKACVDFLLFAKDPDIHYVFDGKCSRKKFKSGLKKYLSHTIHHEDLVPQTAYINNNPDCSAAILFWSPFIDPRFKKHLPGKSVTVNYSCQSLEQSLLHLMPQKSTPDIVGKASTKPQKVSVSEVKNTKRLKNK